MSCRFLRVQVFVVAAVLSIAMLLFAATHRDNAVGPQYKTVIDLSTSIPASSQTILSQTTLVAPAELGGAWNLETLPSTRLIAPLAVIEAEHKKFPDSESLITMDDVATYERLHGAVPQGAIILLASVRSGTSPVLNHDALHFLVEARNVVGIGGAGTQLVSSGENSYLARKGIYELENISNLAVVPRSNVVGVAAPEKIAGANHGPVRLMVLVK
jgi:kynurenine formamidase